MSDNHAISYYVASFSTFILWIMINNIIFVSKKRSETANDSDPFGNKFMEKKNSA